MQTRLIELRRHLQGWVGLVPLKSFYKELDKWLRRRVRDCYWRDWRRLRTRVRNLLQLGLRKREALTLVRTRMLGRVAGVPEQSGSHCR